MKALQFVSEKKEAVEKVGVTFQLQSFFSKSPALNIPYVKALHLVGACPEHH